MYPTQITSHHTKQTKKEEEQLMNFIDFYNSNIIKYKNYTITMGENTKTIIPFIYNEPKQQQPKQCRICLQTQNQGDFVHPCGCEGSTGFVHEECIRQWIRRILQERQKIRNWIICQICHEKIQFDVKLQRQCASSTILVENIHQSGNVFLIFIIVVILTIGCWGYLIYLFDKIIKQTPETETSRTTGFIVYLILVCALTFIILIQVVFFIKVYCLNEKKVIENIRQFQKRKQQHLTGIALRTKIIPQEIVSDFY